MLPSFEARRRWLAPPAITAKPLRGDDASFRDLIILQQPLDVFEFDLRTLRIGQPAAEFFQNAANPLHIDLAGNLDRQIVAEFAPMQRPPQRIVGIAAVLLTPCAIARTVALPVAITLLHPLRKLLGALAQGFQRLS